MKKLFILIIAVLLKVSVFAQSPQKMSYQAVIRNSSDALVVNTQIGMEINILKGSVSGTVIYTETQTPTTNANGLVSIEIGGEAGFNSIDWSAGPYFIKTKIAVVAPLTNYTITGTSQLLSVPYALHAKTAESIVGGGTTGNFTHYIGEQYGGGVIFYLWKDNAGVEHGLIVALTDQSTSQVWSNVISTSDWYLPSIQELTMLWNNYYVVAKSLSQIPGATLLINSEYSAYWSSTETSSNGAYNFRCLGGQVYWSPKDSKCAVRAVRAF